MPGTRIPVLYSEMLNRIRKLQALQMAIEDVSKPRQSGFRGLVNKISKVRMETAQINGYNRELDRSFQQFSVRSTVFQRDSISKLLYHLDFGASIHCRPRSLNHSNRSINGSEYSGSSIIRYYYRDLSLLVLMHYSDIQSSR
jgi:hypothetical protein